MQIDELVLESVDYDPKTGSASQLQGRDTFMTSEGYQVLLFEEAGHYRVAHSSVPGRYVLFPTHRVRRAIVSEVG